VQICSYSRAGCYIHVASCHINEALTSVQYVGFRAQCYIHIASCHVNEVLTEV